MENDLSPGFCKHAGCLRKFNKVLRETSGWTCFKKNDNQRGRTADNIVETDNTIMIKTGAKRKVYKPLPIIIGQKKKHVAPGPSGIKVKVVNCPSELRSTEDPAISGGAWSPDRPRSYDRGAADITTTTPATSDKPVAQKIDTIVLSSDEDDTDDTEELLMKCFMTEDSTLSTSQLINEIPGMPTVGQPVVEDEDSFDDIPDDIIESAVKELTKTKGLRTGKERVVPQTSAKEKGHQTKRATNLVNNGYQTIESLIKWVEQGITTDRWRLDIKVFYHSTRDATVVPTICQHTRWQETVAGYMDQVMTGDVQRIFVVMESL